MAADEPKPITFIVPGQASSATRGGDAPPPEAPALPGFDVHQSVQVGAVRGEAAAVPMQAVPGRDVVVLSIANGPDLILHPETARVLLAAQVGGAGSPPAAPRAGRRARGARSARRSTPAATTVPSRLRWSGLDQAPDARGATRAGIGDVLVSALHVLTGKAIGKAAKLTAGSLIVRKFDDQVTAGVYRLEPNTLPKLKGAPVIDAVPAAPNEADPTLVLVHGTFSDTTGFQKLWVQHPSSVRSLFDRYGGRVYGLDHPTLGVSPIANALTLAKAMPAGGRLHLLTHSRGGLVAEALARVCSDPGDSFEEFGGAAYRRDRDDLRALAALVRQRRLKVDRVVRVAAPARGTLLASGRLDAYVSVFKWVLELAHIPVAGVMLEFLGEVAKLRADPAVLPGLAAMMPDSPLVQWIHRVERRVEGDLRVIAGDIQGDSVTTWLKTLLTDAFFWTDHDLVVQTRSMYGGGPRANDATFVLDRGGKVNHFEYFSNPRTADAITAALREDAPTGFRPIGPLSAAGKDASGVRARRPAADVRPAAEKPAVFLLPGILGSNLAVNRDRIWLGWRMINGFARLEIAAPGVRADGPLDMFYGKLSEFLSRPPDGPTARESHDVIEFGFDWRRPVEEEAKRLAQAVAAALDARKATKQPVRILAHSMGGIIARVMQLVSEPVWKRMMDHERARFVMLGTPNAGSWVPMQVLSGDNGFTNMLALVGAPFREHIARGLMAEFPGFLQLQAGLGRKAPLGLGRRDAWARLQAQDLAHVDGGGWHSLEIQRLAHTWGLPPQAVLDRAVALRDRLDGQLDALAKYHDRMRLVVGRARLTPVGVQSGDQGVVYLDVPDAGDGTVTWESAMLDGVPTWMVDTEHSRLPDAKAAFDGYLDLLSAGDTKRLARLPAARASQAAAAPLALVPSRPSRSPDSGAPPLPPHERAALPDVEMTDSRAALTVLRVGVVHGDLSFVTEPLLIGHYRSIALTGAESVMDGLIGGTMSKSLDAHVYPDTPGSHQVFVNTHARPDNPFQVPRPQAVVVVGLGDEGKLRPSDLAGSVRKAVVAWGQRLAERPGFTPQLFELASTFIGSGGSGIEVGASAVAIARGVRQANRDLLANGWPVVRRIRLIELYLDRATEALQALRRDSATEAGELDVADIIEAGDGGLERPLDPGYRGANYDLVTATAAPAREGETVIAYTLDTRRARAELTAQAIQKPLIRELSTAASAGADRDALIGNTLFQLLIPLEMQPFFDGSTDMVLELEPQTAGIPWELVDSRTDQEPWGLRSRLLRKLRVAEFRTRVVDSGRDAHVLVIGEPFADEQRYARLPGAWAEASAVAESLRGHERIGADRVRALISADVSQRGFNGRDIIDALMERPWRVVHIAGHGEPPERLGPVPVLPTDPPQRDGDPRGVVLSNGTFLGPREIRAMGRVPELVFVNCCYLAERNQGQLLGGQAPFEPPKFASGVAEELIKIGVRCVVAAGWAVDDEAASAFARTFYQALLAGDPFIAAVHAARRAARDKGGNTWAAYQCYGDPDWRLDIAGDPSPEASARYAFDPGKSYAAVVSPEALHLALDEIATRSHFGHPDMAKQRAKLEFLETHHGPRWGKRGEIAEAFGRAWWESQDAGKSIQWYERAVQAQDGRSSLKAAEQLANVMVRAAAEQVTPGAARAVQDDARARIGRAIEQLERLVAIDSTLERECLLGSAYKRLAMIEAAAKRAPAERDAILAMRKHYQNAVTDGRVQRRVGLYYPALNVIAADLALGIGTPGWRGLDDAVVQAARANIERMAETHPDFWSVVSQTELVIYAAVAKGRLAESLSVILADLDDVHRRVQALRNWASCRDTQRFVLGKYGERTRDAGERRAVAAVLEVLERFAVGSDAARPARRVATRKARASGRKPLEAEARGARRKKGRVRAPRSPRPRGRA